MNKKNILIGVLVLIIVRQYQVRRSIKYKVVNNQYTTRF